MTHTFRVDLKISQDGGCAIFEVQATSSVTAVIIAIQRYSSKANYTVYEIYVKRLYD